MLERDRQLGVVLGSQDKIESFKYLIGRKNYSNVQNLYESVTYFGFQVIKLPVETSQRQSICMVVSILVINAERFRARNRGRDHGQSIKSGGRFERIQQR